MKVLKCIVVGFAISVALMGRAQVNWPGFVSSAERKVMETEPRFPTHGKGGIGTMGNNLYVVTKSAKNEVILSSGQRWSGQNSSISEIVVILDGKIWSASALPHNFDKNKCVIISFEKENIRFYDYVGRRGGYYERLASN